MSKLKKSQKKAIGDRKRTKDSDMYESIMRDLTTYSFLDKDGNDVVVNLYDRIRVDPDNLEQCMYEHAGWFVFIGCLQAEAEELAQRKEARVKRILEEQKIEVRKQLIKKNGKCTEAEVTALASVSKVYQKAQIAAFAARKSANILENALSGLRQRERTMEAINARHLKEMVAPNVLKGSVEKMLEGDDEDQNQDF